jgi:hypothetical protein
MYNCNRHGVKSWASKSISLQNCAQRDCHPNRDIHHSWARLAQSLPWHAIARVITMTFEVSCDIGEMAFSGAEMMQMTDPPWLRWQELGPVGRSDPRVSVVESARSLLGVFFYVASADRTTT